MDAHPLPPPGSLGRPTLSAGAARYVLDLIQREQLRAGAAMPSEAEIVRTLGISRGSAREAYSSLAAMGILAVEPGRRPQLKPLDPQVLTRIFDYALTTAQVSPDQVMDTRRAIELACARLAAQQASAEHRAQLQALAAEMRAAGADRSRRVQADIAIHVLIAEAGGNPLNRVLLQALRTPLEDSVRLHQSDQRSAEEIATVIQAHEDLVAAVCAGQPDAAEAAMARHFDLSIHHRPAPGTHPS